MSHFRLQVNDMSEIISLIIMVVIIGTSLDMGKIIPQGHLYYVLQCNGWSYYM